MTPSETMLGNQMDRVQRGALLVGVVGLLLCLIGVFVDRDQFFRSYLFGYLFWHGNGGGKPRDSDDQPRRRADAGASSPAGCSRRARGRRRSWRACDSGTAWNGIAVPVGSRRRGAARSRMQLKQAYLNVPFFIIRLVIYFGIWMFYGITLRRWSLQQDQSSDPL